MRSSKCGRELILDMRGFEGVDEGYGLNSRWRIIVLEFPFYRLNLTFNVSRVDFEFIQQHKPGLLGRFALAVCNHPHFFSDATPNLHFHNRQKHPHTNNLAVAVAVVTVGLTFRAKHHH